MIILLAIILLVAVREDLATRRIPNRLTLGGTVIALILATAIGGWHGLTDHFWGALIAGGIWFIFWHLGMMGGGDQKLMMAVGAFVGQDLALPLVFAVAIAGGVQALLWLFITKSVIPTPSQVEGEGTRLITRFVIPSASEGTRPSLSQKLRTTHIPYSLAIALGTVAVLLLDHFGRLPQLF